MSIRLAKKFRQYHAQNPHIYEAFERFALQAAKFRNKYSARAIIHRMRWETMIEDNEEDFKISNDYTPYYARLFEERNPHLKGFFRKKKILPGE